ncbi:acetyltransferase (GNAT) family protein [Kineococcus rhizosphaerae]|uniref:Acetyltransferase (GNAT) family protein n=2 Tax=Kineococcus rhizosphaerae TaxID=559628 RepID=A0A2T0R7J6_9ACTN|nr:acetyltransferase (GNAT) family protein [Kineococcus rhizosphaerae]
MIVRAMAPGDALAVAEFQTRTWDECYADLVPRAYLDAQRVPERFARWSRTLRTGARGCALAEVGGVVVGAVSWVPGELKSLYVAAGHRGSGVADRLLEHAIGTSSSTLWVFRDNARARRFYARHRFSVVDGSERVDAGTGVPEVQMSRP